MSSTERVHVVTACVEAEFGPSPALPDAVAEILEHFVRGKIEDPRLDVIPRGIWHATQRLGSHLDRAEHSSRTNAILMSLVRQGVVDATRLASLPPGADADQVIDYLRNHDYLDSIGHRVVSDGSDAPRRAQGVKYADSDEADDLVEEYFIDVVSGRPSTELVSIALADATEPVFCIQGDTWALTLVRGDPEAVTPPEIAHFLLSSLWWGTLAWREAPLPQ